MDLSSIMSLDTKSPTPRLGRPDSTVTFNLDEDAALAAFHKNLKRLDVHQEKEYQSWLTEWKVKGLDGETISAEKMIEETVNILNVLLQAASKLDKQAADKGRLLIQPVKAISGQPGGWGNPEFMQIPNLYLALLVDASGSMQSKVQGWTKTQIARVTALVLLESFYKHNLERAKSEKKALPFMLEVGKFDDDTALFISHEQFENADEAEMRWLIYHAIKSFETGGGTEYSQAVQEYINHIASLGISTDYLKSIFVLTDEEVGDTQEEAVRAALQTANANEILTQVVPQGNQTVINKSLDLHGAENSLNPALFEGRLELASLVIVAKVISQFRERFDLVVPGFFAPYVAAVETARSEMRIDPKRLRDITGYQLFKFYTDEDGREFFVYNAGGHYTSWQRAPGGPQVPQGTPAMNEENELILYELISKLWRPNLVFTSINPDNRYFIREAENGKIELFFRESANESWRSLAKWGVNYQAVSEEKGYRGANGVTWETAGTGKVKVSLPDQSEFKIDLPEGASADQIYLEGSGDDTVYLFDASQKRVQVYKKSGKTW